ncbi:hypothetical protein BB561_002068 [Smittium simulii]|uniref:Uncharacterized protein n=1 Tax=Smittium simulii TaxID=133385 RepID=A0A2T9YRX6_9FUNG|nr:hypothetical protein BB561_002068 [Smittium simulii]
MRGTKHVNIPQLQQKFAVIQAELKKALDSVEAGQYLVRLALESVPFEGFDAPKFWRTLNQCWIFTLERSSVANSALIATKNSDLKECLASVVGDNNSTAQQKFSEESEMAQTSLNVQQTQHGSNTHARLDSDLVYNITSQESISNKMQKIFEGQELSKISETIETNQRNSSKNKSAESLELLKFGDMVYDQKYILDLQEKVVAWSESLACYGLVDYEMGFWETDIMDTLESIRKSIL